MLDIAHPARVRSRASCADPFPQPAPAAPPPSLPELTRFLRRQWPTIAAALVAALALGIAYLALTAPRYTAKTLLMLDTRRAQVFQQQSVVGEMNFDDAAVASQVEMLKSANVAAAVIRDLSLAEDPEFTGGASGFSASLLGGLAALANEEPSRQAATKLRRELSVQRVGRTYVLEIGVTSGDRHKAARIANAVAEAYIRDQLEAKVGATRRANAWLRERMDELRDEAIKSDRAVQTFRAENQLVETNGRTVTDQQLGEINTQLVAARAATAEARARLDRMSEVGRDGAVSAAIADALKNEVVSRLRQQWVERSKREAELSARYGPDHLAAVTLRKELAQIQRLTAEELRGIAETYRGDFEIARNRELALEKILGAAVDRAAASKQAEVALRVLESSAQSYRNLYDSFLSRSVEATQQQSFPNTEARVITAASIGERSEPRAASILAFSVVAGLACGAGAAFLREQLDRSFRLPQQVETLLGLECLGVLPRIDGAGSAHKLAGMLQRAPSHLLERPILRNLGIGRHVVAEPFSRFAEVLRAVRVSADTSLPAGHAQVIGIVSALPAEGKSTIALNLAAQIAQAGSRTLLVDGDLRNPTLTGLVSPDARWGLMEVLDGRAEIPDVVWTDPLTGMQFLPALIGKATAHTGGMISSQAMGRLLATARTEYDYVVVDLSPIMPVADARAASHLIDGFLLVIEWGGTASEAVAEAMQSAEVIRERMIGAVLNKADTKVLSRLEAYKGARYQRYCGNEQHG